MIAPCDDPTRLADFLATHGLSGVRAQPLAGDASTRRYQRLYRDAGPSLILMQAPNPATELIPFVEVADWLRGLGLSVPEIMAIDADSGLLVMEDFGHDTMAAALDRGADPQPLYRRATEVLIALHRARAAVPTGWPIYDSRAFGAQVQLLPALAFPDAPEIALEFERAWQAVTASALLGPPVVMLRDYHAGNLMVLAERPGVRGCGLLDFQDAGAGPAAYDVMSLLEDARRDVAPPLAAALLDHYLAAFPDLDRAAFHHSAQVLAAIRHTRVIAVFWRLAQSGKDGYLCHLPRVWRSLERHLTSPALAPVAAWFARHLPADKRHAVIIPEAKL